MDERVVITRPLPGDAAARLASAGFTNVWINSDDTRLDRGDLLEAIRGAHAVISTPADTLIDAEFFDAAGDQLVIVSNYAVGVDNIDLDEAARRGVLVGHTPHAVTEPTADIAWLLMLAASKRAYEGDSLVRSGTWAGVGPNELLGLRVVGKTLLIVGAGRIGLATARRALGWEMSILYNARSQHPEFEGEPLRARRISLEDGLREADFVSIHTPLTDETRHLINAERLSLMKPTAVLVNTARGPIVDESALVAALRSGTIAAAGLDVLEHEPTLAPGLADLPNVFLLPHLGTATVEDRDWMMRIAVDNVAAALRGENVPHAYPLPAVHP
jgi:glyoxylate reductase